MRYWQLTDYLEKEDIKLAYKQGYMEAYFDIEFIFENRLVVIESCMNSFYITQKNNFSVIADQYELSEYKTSEEVMKMLKTKYK